MAGEVTVSNGEQPGTGIHYGWIVTIAAFAVSTVAYGVFYSYGLFFPRIIADYGWTYADVSGAFSIAIITYGFFAIPMGWVADRYGPRIAVGAGGVIFGFGIYLGSHVSEIWHLYIVYGLVTALGMGAGYVPLVSTVSRWFVTRRGIAIGIASLGSGTGTFLLTPLISNLIDANGWRQSYVIAGFGAAAIMVIAAAFLFRDPEKRGLKPYGVGTALARKRLAKPAARGHDLSLREAFGCPAFWFVMLAFSLWWFASLIPYIHGVSYMRDKGFSAGDAAIWLSLLGLGISIGKVAVGALADRIGTKAAWSITTVVEVTGMLLLVAMNSPAALYLLAVVTGFGYGGGSTVFTNVVTEQFGLRSIGAIYGMLFFGVSVLGAWGPWTAGFVRDLTGEYTVAYFAAGLLLLGCLLFNLLLRSPSYGDPSVEALATK